MSETQYFNLIKETLKGNERTTRNGQVTSLFSPSQLRFNLDSYPLLTSKFVNFNNVANELLWFLKGQTNGKILKDQNTFIWAGNGTREYLDSVGLTENDQDDLGPIYGFQWRHFGAEYINCNTNYKEKGVDQISNLIEQIIFNPNSRRMILTAWNPKSQDKMALPPCHIFSQFYVCDSKLDCHLYQRSADIGLGVPYNIASYSLLTIILAHFTGLEPGRFIYTIGDSHIYSSHKRKLLEQTSNQIHDFPKFIINKPKPSKNTLQFTPNITESIVKEIESLTLKDFTLSNYNHEEKIFLKFY